MNPDLGNLSIVGVSVVGLVIALTEKVKKVAPRADPEAVSMALGAVLMGLGYLYAAGVPSTLEEAVALVIFMCAGCVSPSGLYETGQTLLQPKRA